MTDRYLTPKKWCDNHGKMPSQYVLNWLEEYACQKVWEFQTEIMHGDHQHREWLKNAANQFNWNQRIEKPVVNGPIGVLSQGVLLKANSAYDWPVVLYYFAAGVMTARAIDTVIWLGKGVFW